MADVLEAQLLTALDEKMTLNASKYPVELAKGTARKYDQLGQEGQ